MKISGFKYLANQGVENIWKNKMMAFATFCVLLISLLLVGVASLFYINMNSMILGLNDKNEIVVHLNVGTPDDEVKKAEEDLRKIPNVDKITFISKEEALVRQRASLTSAEKIFNDYIGDDASFMPDGFSVTVKNNDIIADTTAEINAMPVVQKAQSSLQVAEFLKELRRVVSLIAGAIVIALAAVSIIMISNTTKASVFARREEIQIMKYVGATNSFIRTPFFVEGMVTGLFAGTGAFFITWSVYQAIFKVMQSEETLMNAFGLGSLIPFEDIRLYVLIAYLVAGSFVGALGSVISTRRHVDV
ncbi:MAG: permease-like cell division protein FtsX [Ruminococcus flavefaciens]|nr:permease-like cell division protein FtsX [Ruminococcus flavefaciens]MCM1363090.1 permease-like cell division protein FtsX [Clostridiales bacterium]MCM1435674.1 permease-like cell division protein FtsX [Ruminococcus flavefaciens]